MGCLFLKVGWSNAYLEVQRNKVLDTLEVSKAVYCCFAAMRSQPTTSDLLKNKSLSAAVTEMDAETCLL